MFKHLLVPLDGSRMAESALPAARYLASTLKASVTLVHIIERDAPQAVHGDRHLTRPDEAYSYLKNVAQSAFSDDLCVEQHVHTNQIADMARGILDHVGELTPDLIVMCTHGRGGLRTLLLGAIAQQVVARGATPVLLVRPTGRRSGAPFIITRVLVPLDGTASHEQGLPLAVELARACAATVHLVLVVPTVGTLSGHQAATGMLLPRATEAVLELVQQDAAEYLQRHLIQLEAQGISGRAEVCRGDPTGAIVATAKRAGVDLIVLGTHGKVGTDAFWSGSVAPKVSNRSRLPLLLVPLPEPGADA
jgi:nucleotide-binding universal stress UspA family protein